MKSKLVDQYRKDAGLEGSPRPPVEFAVNQVFASLANALEEHGRITIPGFGTFTRKFVDTRQVRNPRTGERVTKIAHHVIKFKAARSK